MEIINLIIEQSGKKRKIPFNIYDTIQNVLTKACEEFNVRTEDHELWFANKLLDIDLELNKTDLPPEAVLTLCPCSSNDIVSVDLIIGNNINSKKFKCSATLWDISQELLPEDKYIEDDRIQISYFGKTVVGRQNLKKILISSLAQNDGKITLKLSRSYSGTDLTIDELQRNNNSINSSKLSACRSTKGESASKNIEYQNKSCSKHQDESLTKKMSTRRFTGSVKALSNIDKSVYKNSNEKVKGIVHLDQRKGLIYNMKSLSSVEKIGSDLLGLNEENPTSIRGREKEIPLKIIFPDQTVIKATFSSEETVGDIYNFISSLLKQPTSTFILDTKNPKSDLDQEMLLKNISGKFKDTFYVRSCPGVPKLMTFQSLKKILQPNPLPKLKNNEKKWMISIKK